RGTAPDLVAGSELPVPVVMGKPPYLTEREAEAGGVVSLPDVVNRRREEFICGDLGDDDRVVNSPELLDAGVRSIACCPLVSRSEVSAVLLLYGAQPNTFRQSDRRRLRDFCNVLALALDRTRHLERSRKEISEAEVIARIGRSLLELPSRTALLQGAVEALRAFRDYFDVSLFRIDKEAAECALVAEAGRERRYRPSEYRQKIGEGFIGLCAQTGETIRVSDLAADSRRLIAFDEEYRARSELAVPVKKGEEVLGVMHFLSEREDDFPESETAALEHVAPHIGVALQNARMILERRRDRYKIEQAHEELANIIRSAAVGITSTDTRGVYTHWSPSCESMLGYEEEEVVGRATPSDFAAEPYDLQEVLDECLREGRTTAERKMARKDGSVRVIREARVPMHDEEGRHVGFTDYLVDITDQKRAEEQLRRERDTLNLVVEAMGAGLALLDGDMEMQWANSAMMKWFGFGTSSFGKNCHEVLRCGSPADDCPAVRAVSTGEVQTLVHEVTDETGVWHCYQHVFTPVVYGETRLLVLTLDITEQRRQTEEMRLINKLTEKVETSLDLGRVLHLVLTCVTAGHAIGFNRAFVFLLDEEGAHLEGKSAVGPVSPADAQRIWNDLAQKAQTIDELVDAASPSGSDRRLADRVRALHIPLADRRNPLVRALDSRSTVHVGDARSAPYIGPELVERLELEEFVCVP
ncbi:MAG: GAF domain-containing protein, partial [Candidatus Brocadiae bacterium]|nr:GAF domain-containing protein [Candidatus Brocadiia bacterium]